MHRYKPLLPLGQTTLIGAVICLFHKVGIREVVVVTGHNHDQLAPVAEAAGARVVFNPGYDQGMFSSIQAGVRELARDLDAVFLLPADIPAIRPATLALMLKAYQEDPGRILVPRFRGEPGHPPLMPSSLFPVIADAGPTASLRQILFAGEMDSLAVPDQGILMDADIRADYEALVQGHPSLEIPNPAECQAILDQEALDQKLLAHLALERDGLTETEIVYFADKLCQSRVLVLDLNFEQRFLDKMEAFPEARERIAQRLETTRIIQSRIQSLTGRSVREILG